MEIERMESSRRFKTQGPIMIPAKIIPNSGGK